MCQSAIDGKGYPQGLWSFLVCEVGFQYRLGTCIMREAIMLEARLLLLPVTLPVNQLLMLARTSCLPNWANQVLEVRRRLNNLPDVLEVFGDAVTEALRLSADARRKLAKQYRREVVLPALKEYDSYAMRSSSQKSNWPYFDFQEPLIKFGDALLTASWNKLDWKMYTVWALARATGRIPLPVFGANYLPETLDSCPLCSTSRVGLSHLLYQCTECRYERSLLRYKAQNWGSFCRYVFGGDAIFNSEGRPAQRVQFVYEVTLMVSQGLVCSDDSEFSC